MRSKPNGSGQILVQVHVNLATVLLPIFKTLNCCPGHKMHAHILPVVDTLNIDKTVRWHIEKSSSEGSSGSMQTAEPDRQYSQHQKRHVCCKLSVFSPVVVQGQIQPK